jgi:hypothetical protein
MFLSSISHYPQACNKVRILYAVLVSLHKFQTAVRGSVDNYEAQGKRKEEYFFIDEIWVESNFKCKDLESER